MKTPDLYPGNKLTYVSGPISGRKRIDYLQEFRLYADMLRFVGLRPLNPTTMYGFFQPTFNLLPYRLQLMIDLILLSLCCRIIMLPNWQNSVGANLEYEFSEAFFIEIQDPDWLKDQVERKKSIDSYCAGA